MPAPATDAAGLGRESLRRIDRFLHDTNGLVGGLGLDLLARHGYAGGGEGGAPHDNVLGHPLFELPIWVDAATGEGGRLGSGELGDIAESALSGYLSVRAEDDFFDEVTGEPRPVMMLSSLFRVRHLALLGSHVDDARFWSRVAELWRAYGEAMLLEHGLHRKESDYGDADFEAVLDRSQPLEIPGLAVLAMKGRWDLADDLSHMVRHLVTATQLFDDLVDAPGDLRAGNYTPTVRRLGGLDGLPSLARALILAADDVVAESEGELDEAVRTGASLAGDEMLAWVAARKAVMRAAVQRMKEAFFAAVPAESER